MGGPEKGRLLKDLESKNLFLGLLWEKDSLDVWKDTTLSNGNFSKKFVQFFVISDGELKMSWNNSGLLVITVASEFKNFSGQVLHDSFIVYGIRWNEPL